MKIIGGTISPWVKRVLITLEEKGIPYEKETYYPMGNPCAEFLKKSPLGTIPVMEEGNRTLADSTAICLYLEKQYPSPSLSWPNDAADAAWKEAQTHWFFDVTNVFFSKVEVPLFFNQVINPMLRQPTSEEAIESAREKAKVHLKFLDEHLNQSKFLIGDDFSMADIALCSVMINYLHAGERAELHKYPALAEYVESILQRDSFAAVLKMDMLELNQHTKINK